MTILKAFGLAFSLTLATLAVSFSMGGGLSIF